MRGGSAGSAQALGGGEAHPLAERQVGGVGAQPEQRVGRLVGRGVQQHQLAVGIAQLDEQLHRLPGMSYAVRVAPGHRALRRVDGQLGSDLAARRGDQDGQQERPRPRAAGH